MNESEKLIIIGSYPSAGKVHARRVVGCASYGKDTALAIKNTWQGKIKITVLADIFRRKTTYQDDGIKVKRMWSPNSFFSFPKILKEIFLNHKDTKNVLFEFEVLMFGNFIFLIPLPLFNLALRLLGKDVTFVCHQVINDIRDFEGHTNIKKESIKSRILDLIIPIFYRLVILSVDKVIVFDEELKLSLQKFGDPSKIKVIPLAFNAIPSDLTAREARQKLKINENDFVILSFGFLAWYKGTDWLIEAYKQLDKKIKGKNVKLILAGGPARNHKDKEFYKNYISWINKEVKKNKIMLTGFVPEEEIAKYYLASDLVVFPYRLQMSASGPMSIAYSFHKPILVSHRLKNIFKTEDIQRIIREQALSTQDLSFKLSYSDFEDKIKNLIENPSSLNQLTRLSTDVSKARSWEKVGRDHAQYIFSEKNQIKTNNLAISEI